MFNIDKRLYKYSWPIFIELVLQMLVANVDKIMVNGITNTGASAITNASSVMDLLVITFTVISLSVTILCAQFFGSNNKERVEQVYALGLLVNGVFGIFITIILWIFGPSIFKMMQIPNECYQEALDYLNICAAGLMFQGLYATYVAMFRCNGWMKETMFVSSLMNGLNIVGNYFLINGIGVFPVLGVKGAAISSVASRIIGLILLVVWFNNKSDIKVSLSCLNPWPGQLFKTMLKIGLPSGGESISYNASQMVILSMINNFGNAIVQVRTFANMFAMIGYLLGCAVSQAVQIIVGYEVGANNLDNAYKQTRNAAIISVILNGSVSFIIFIFSGQLFSLFVPSEMLQVVKTVTFVDFILEIGRAVNMTMVRCLQAVGDIQFPIMCGIISMWSVAIGIGYFCGIVLQLGLAGIWIGMACDECFRAILFTLRWEKGKWRSSSLLVNI